MKVGAYVSDTIPDLADIEPEWADHSVSWRLFARRGFSHPRMWAQYADEGRGACLVLDFEALKSAVESSVGRRCSWGYGPVSYTSPEGLSLGFYDARDLSTIGAVGALLKNFELGLLQKHDDWSHEAEFRFFIVDRSSNEWLTPIDNAAIVGVVVGPTFDDQHDLLELRAFARSFGIAGRVRRIRWTHGVPELDRLQ